MVKQSDLQHLNDMGFVCIRGFLRELECDSIRTELEAAIAQDLSERPAAFDRGMVHNCFMRGDRMMDHLKSIDLRDATGSLLCDNAIIYAYQSSSLPPNGQNYGSRIHVDCPRFIPGYRSNLGYILALDNFTKENGATFVLPTSHRFSEAPNEKDFQRDAIQLECKKGDAIFFDGRLWHKAGENRTSLWRHGLTINFCRPFMRSRFDFPRMISSSGLSEPTNEIARKFLGYDVRMPTSLDEFYLPPEERLYKPGQE